MTSAVESGEIVTSVVQWYRANARELPWRAADRTPWGVLVSEVMLQQTPVARVEPVWHDWMSRWPAPTDLAAASPADAIRAWGRLGYPRRALRLHEAAQTIVAQHDGVVPADHDALLSLPGIGDYTAAAVASFAFGQRYPVLDTNVRRVLARSRDGRQFPRSSVSVAERALAATLLPDDGTAAAEVSVGLMELGALVCTSRAPQCAVCPVQDACAWRRAGSPAHDGPPRRAQAWHGTDRQARGRLMAVMRAATRPVPLAELEAAWADGPQRKRALATLVADGLVNDTGEGFYSLPHSSS